MTTNKVFSLRRFNVYTAHHPDGKAHDDAVVIIKNTIKHHVMAEFKTEQMQACSIVVTDWLGPLTMASVYCPPGHLITENMFNDFFKKPATNLS